MPWLIGEPLRPSRSWPWIGISAEDRGAMRTGSRRSQARSRQMRAHCHDIPMMAQCTGIPHHAHGLSRNEVTCLRTVVLGYQYIGIEPASTRGTRIICFWNRDPKSYDSRAFQALLACMRAHQSCSAHMKTLGASATPYKLTSVAMPALMSHDFS